jgi:hypothetical protein
MIRGARRTTEGELSDLVRRVRSSYDADFAGLNDSREITLAEVQICPDDGRRLAVGRIDQIDRPFGQRVLRQQRHQALISDGRGREEGRKLGHYVAAECAAAQVMVIVCGQHCLWLDHVSAQFPSARDIDARRPYSTRETMKRIWLGWHAEALHQLWTGHENIAKGEYMSRHHGLVNNRADAKSDIDAVLDEVEATFG